MTERSIRLSSSEIAGLWGSYFQESMNQCMLTYFIYHNQDEEIKEVLQNASKESVSLLEQITNIAHQEGIELPVGFSEKDLDLSAPPLFYDPFGLSYVYSMSRMSMINASFITSNVARADVMNVFVEMIQKYSSLYQQSTSLMLKKGIYDRPPMVPYPHKEEYVDKVTYLNGIGKKRPLNVMELTEIFFNTERNYFSVLLCMGLLQVVKDKEIHDFIRAGKKISERQIQTLNDLLMREELLGNISTTVEVTDSTLNPFSDRLIVSLFHSLNGIDVTMLGHSLSLSLRTDLAAFYQKFILEVLAYAARAFDLMVDRGWMQKPPHAPNRKELQKLD